MADESNGTALPRPMAKGAILRGDMTTVPGRTAVPLVAAREESGIWGGLDDAERKCLARRQRERARCAAAGGGAA
jgi:hypothetical protein